MLCTTYQGLPNPYGQILLCLNQYNNMAQYTQDLNNTATRTVQGGLNAMFSGNVFAMRYHHLHKRSSDNSSTILTVNISSSVLLFRIIQNVILICFKSYLVEQISLSNTQHLVLIRSLTLTDLHRMGIPHECSDVKELMECFILLGN